MTAKTVNNAIIISQTLTSIGEIYDKITSIVNTDDFGLNLKNFPAFKNDTDILRASLDKFSKLFDTVLNLTTDKNINDDTLKILRHDLRAAISSVLGYSELIMEDAEALIEFNQSYFNQINQLCHQILPLIDKLKSCQTLHEIREPVEKTKQKLSIHPGCILIIDDSKEKSQILGRRLINVGHHVLYAEDGAQGLDILTKALPKVDVILLDMIMPGLNGYEVLLKIKDNPVWREIPILVISTLNDMRNIIECIQAGADDYLPMPVNNTLLHARINSCIEKKLAHDRERDMVIAVKNAQNRLTTAIDSLDEGFAIFDSDDKLISCNPKFKEIYASVEKLSDKNFSYFEFLKMNLKLRLYQSDNRNVVKKRSQDLDLSDDNKRIELYMGYHTNPTKPYNLLLSSGKWIEVIENKIPGGGIVAIHKDISEGKQKEDKLEYLARHDPLTGLANRTRLNQFLTELVSDNKNTDVTGLAFFDLDGFKKVNDQLGHDFGDYLLLEVAHKLKSITRSQDLVARIGGDEFVVVLTNLKSPDQAGTYAKRCLETVGNHVYKDGVRADFGVSIGLALMPLHANNPKDLLLKADEAMYQAKKAGKNRYCFSTPI